MILSMQLAAILDRIQSRLRALKMSANRASVLCGKAGAIRNLKRAIKDGNRQGISTATLDALAPVLQTTAEWLMTGNGIEETGPVSFASEENYAASIPVDSFLIFAGSIGAELGLDNEAAHRFARAALESVLRPPNRLVAAPAREQVRLRVLDVLGQFPSPKPRK